MQGLFKCNYGMKNSIKLKNGKPLEELIKDPIKLAIIVQIAFSMDEDLGEAQISFPRKWEAKVGDLVMSGLIEHEDNKVYRLLNKKVVDITLKRKPKKQGLDNQLLSSELLVVPKELKEYYELAIYFKELFYNNLKSIGGRKTNIERAKFGAWVTPIRLMFENDGVTLEQMRAVYRFLKNDSFWKDKVQSTQKLREKFNTLYNQYKSNEKRVNNKGKGGGVGGRDTKVSPDYVKRVLNDLQS